MATVTDKTLMDQMGIGELEIAHRMHLFNFSAEHSEALRGCREIASQRIDAIVADFYEHQLSIPEIDRLIGDSDTLSRLMASVRDYILTLFEANYDANYVNNRLRIGKVHKRIGVSPKLYMMSLKALQSTIEKHFSDLPADGPMPGSNVMKEALHKALLFDAQLILDSYVDAFMSEVDLARSEVQQYASLLGITTSVQTRQLQALSNKDNLTGLYNYRMFQEFLEHETMVAKRHGLPLSLVCLDLNRFKNLNDSAGHAEGNVILKQIGSAMLESVRLIDIPCRFGGDEFFIIMPRTDVKAALTPCRRLIEVFKTRRKHPIDFCIGLAQTGPDKFMPAQELMSAADTLMYRAKALARETTGFHICTEEFGTEFIA